MNFSGSRNSCRFVSLLIFTMSLIAAGSNVKGSNAPSGLSVNLLVHADQVFLNGYPVNTPLSEVYGRNENFQFTEIGQKQPFFGWVVNSVKNNTLQVAYRILVASNQDSLSAGKGDCWDSGKVESDQSVNVYYAGKDLAPGQTYFWKVKTWDNHGVESSYSSVSAFRMAGSLSGYATARYPLQKTDQVPFLIRNLSGTHFFVDFGKDAFGRLRITLNGKSEGDSVTIRLGEAVINGHINQKPGGTIRCSEYSFPLLRGWNTYIVAVRPDKRNTGSRAVKLPEYTGDVTPFRYCEVEGYHGPLEPCHIVREMVNYPFDEQDSYFHSSDTILNKVWDLCKYSMKATSFAGIYVDGDRERIPYEADAYINQLGDYGVSREYSMARYSLEYLIDHATWPTEWILQTVLMAWNDYLYTGNKALLEHYYNDLKAKTLMPLAEKSGLISTRTGKVTPELLQSIHLNDNLRDIVDWPQTGILGLGKNEPGETDGFVFKDVNTVVNAYYYRALTIMGKIAAALGKEDESSLFSSEAMKVKNAFNTSLFDSKHKVYVDGTGTEHASLHANIFPLAFGLAPDKYLDHINSFIQSRGMACSVYGSQFLLDAVYDGNNGGYGLELMSSSAERSWYNMIRSGSTITMEAWDNKYKPNQDWNHAWGAAPANIIPRKLMGIEPVEPGFRKFRIKPQPGTLTFAEIRCPTIRGEIMVSLKNDIKKSFSMNVTIPGNSTADIYLPIMASSQKVALNGSSVAFRREGNCAVVENVGSGNWSFQVIP